MDCRTCNVELTEAERGRHVPMECTACGLARYRRMEAECTEYGTSHRLRALLARHREPVVTALRGTRVTA